ncbi:hypothetical protein [Neolewinella antarctica]|uniref:Uncharacterized protein n=1 Tax=Neolewinella antarctica TaxID=442734 RepID=A0ABX0X9K8_9BACT|nr:hypothetical protein [Neolewinella antarctica]NJC25686.1 hypothetical protein [Neolewinella antarctica]
MNQENLQIPAPTRAADLLEQIERINPLITLNAADPFARDQYLRRKQEFVDELSAILREYELLDGELRAA